MVVSSNEHPNFEICQFTDFEELVKIDEECRSRGYHMKSLDTYSADYSAGGIGLWHFYTEFSLKIDKSGPYKKIISYPEN